MSCRATVDAQAHHGALALGLDVDVAGTLLKGVLEEQVHGAHHVLVGAVELLVAAHVDKLLEVPDVERRGAHLLGLLQRTLEGEDLVDGFQDLGAQAEQGLDRVAGGVLDVVNRRAIVRVHHGDVQPPSLEAHRNHEVLERERLRDDRRELPGIELQGIDAHEDDVGCLGEDAAELFVIDEFAARVFAGEAEARDPSEGR